MENSKYNFRSKAIHMKSDCDTRAWLLNLFPMLSDFWSQSHPVILTWGCRGALWKMQAARDGVWLLDNAPPSLMEFHKEMILVANSNGFKGHLYKVPKLTGYPIRESHIKVTEIIRGQRQKWNSQSSNNVLSPFNPYRSPLLFEERNCFFLLWHQNTKKKNVTIDACN